MILLGLIAAGAFGYFETFDTPLKRTALDAARDVSAGISDDPVDAVIAAKADAASEEMASNKPS